VSPGHERVDILVEMAVGEPGEQIAQVGVGFDAIHLAGAYQAGEASPVPSALVMASKERIASVHGRATDRVFHEVGVDVDMAIVEEEPEAVLAPQHVGERCAKVGFPGDPCGLSRQPGEELVHQRAGHLLADRATVIGV
jgi:hypothetical protein